MRLTVAEYAGVHRDATFSVVRGGLDRWTSKTFPFSLVAYVIAEGETGEVAVGTHALMLSLVHEDGSTVYEMTGEARTDKSEGRVRFAMALSGNVARPGRMALTLSLGDLPPITETLVVVESEV